MSSSADRGTRCLSLKSCLSPTAPTYSCRDNLPVGVRSGKFKFLIAAISKIYPGGREGSYPNRPAALPPGIRTQEHSPQRRRGLLRQRIIWRHQAKSHARLQACECNYWDVSVNWAVGWHRPYGPSAVTRTMPGGRRQRQSCTCITAGVGHEDATVKRADIGRQQNRCAPVQAAGLSGIDRHRKHKLRAARDGLPVSLCCQRRRFPHSFLNSAPAGVQFRWG